MKQNNSDAIFLTTDTLRNDWISKDGEPFIHYIEKTFLNTGHNLYIFNAEKILNFISFENIYNFHIGEEEREKSISGIMTIKCNRCNKIFSLDSNILNLDFGINSTNKRDLGIENSYKAVEYIDCPKCKNEIIASFELWEYPSGIHNYNTIEIENGELLEKPIMRF